MPKLGYGRLQQCCVWLMLLAWSVSGVRAEPSAAMTSYEFGVVPQQSASQLAEDWGPLLAEVGRRAGVTLVFHTTANIPLFEEHLGKKEYDFAYMNPYHYVVFHKAAGYLAYAKEKDRKIKGVIVVRKDSAYKHLQDLRGKEVAFPAPAAFAASIMTQAEFGRHTIAIKSKFVSSHDSVYRAVAAGLAEAGGGIPRTFEAMPAEIHDQLRVLVETPSFTPHAFAAQQRVPKAVVARVSAALLSLSDDEVGRTLLAAVSFKNGMAAAQDRDWNDIRQLDIKLLARYTRE